MSIDALPLAVIVTDADGHVTHINTAAEAYLRQSRKLLTGQNAALVLPDLASLIAEAARDCATIKAYGHTLANGTAINLHIAPDWEHINASQIGTMPRVPLVIVIDPLHNPAMVDRSELQRQNVRFAGMTVAMLAHEIKNPLSSIRSAGQLIEQIVPEERADECAPLTELIVREVDRITGMLGRMEYLSSELPIKAGSVNIHEVLHYACSVLDPELAGGIQVIELFDPSLPEVAGEHDLLVQLFLNLIKNAAEAMAGNDGATLTLRTALERRFRLRSGDILRTPICIEICDNGPGIPPELHSQLFNPVVSAKPGGHGLGLAIAAKIATDHGGTIALKESTAGHTVFQVTLPVAG